MKLYKSIFGNKCKTCGAIENLEFHHIDPSTKLFAIGGNYERKEVDVLKELKKCELLCDTCHKEKHKARHGTLAGYNAYGCRCDDCREAKRQYDITRGANQGLYRMNLPSTHGDLLHYRRGCRCQLCKDAMAQYGRERRNKNYKTIS